MSKLKLVDSQLMAFKPASLDTTQEYVFRQQAPIKHAVMISIPFAFLVAHLILQFLEKSDWMLSVVIIFFAFLIICGIVYFSRQELLKVNQEGIFWMRNGTVSKSLQWKDVEKIHVLVENQYNMPSIVYQSGKTVAHLPKMNWKSNQYHHLSLLDVVSSFRPDMQSISAREVMLLQQGGDIGENSGKMTAIAVVGLLIGALIAFFDSYATIELGGFLYLNIMFAAFGFLWAWRMISSPINMIGGKVIIACLCAVGVYFAASQITIALMSQVISPTPQIFVMHKQIEQEEREVWRSVSGLQVDCILTPRSLGTQKTAQVVQLGDLARLQFTDVCIPRDQLQSNSKGDESVEKAI